MDPDPGKEIEVDPDPDLDPERILKWIRIRINVVDLGGSGSETLNIVAIPRMLISIHQLDNSYNYVMIVRQ